jgi:hypothetical protein
MSAKRKITESKITITDIENPKKTKKEPTRHSAWFITVSTNMAFKDPQDPYVKPVANALAETLQELLDDDEEFQTILNVNKRVTNRDIDHSLSKFDVERGPQNGVIHAHGVIQLRHRSNVQLGYKKFREWIFRELCRKCRKAKIPEPKGVYFNADPLPELASSLDSKARIEEYISKNRKPLNPEGKNVWYSGKQGSKAKNDYVSYQQEEDEEDSMDSNLANKQEEENDDLMGLDFSDDEDLEDEGLEEEPQKTVPTNVVPHVQLKLPRFL